MLTPSYTGWPPHPSMVAIAIVTLLLVLHILIPRDSR